MELDALESPDVGEHSTVDTLDGFAGPLENLLQHFEAKASQKENVFSLHEIGFLTLFFQKFYFHVCFIKKGLWCLTTMRVGAFESLDVGEHSRYLG